MKQTIIFILLTVCFLACTNTSSDKQTSSEETAIKIPGVDYRKADWGFVGPVKKVTMHQPNPYVVLDHEFLFDKKGLLTTHVIKKTIKVQGQEDALEFIVHNYSYKSNQLQSVIVKQYKDRIGGEVMEAKRLKNKLCNYKNNQLVSVYLTPANDKGDGKCFIPKYEGGKLVSWQYKHLKKTGETYQESWLLKSFKNEYDSEGRLKLDGQGKLKLSYAKKGSESIIRKHNAAGQLIVEEIFNSQGGLLRSQNNGRATVYSGHDQYGNWTKSSIKETQLITYY